MVFFELNGISIDEFEAMKDMIGTDLCDYFSFIAFLKDKEKGVICITNDKTLCQIHVDSGKEYTIVQIQVRFI